MVKDAVSQAVQRSKEPSFCCNIQESCSTNDSIWPCPVHSRPCSFDEHTTFEPYEEETHVTKALTPEALGLRLSDAPTTTFSQKLVSVRARFAVWTFQPSLIVRKCRRFFARRAMQGACTHVVMLNQAEVSHIISQLSMVADEAVELASSSSSSGTLPSLVSPYSSPPTSCLSTCYSGSLWSTNGSVEVRRQCDTFGDLVGDINKPQVCWRYDKNRPQYQEADDACNFDGLLDTILFSAGQSSSLAFSSDLCCPNLSNALIRKALWSQIEGQNECSLQWETENDAPKLYLLLRYEMVTITASPEPARFATRICISSLIPEPVSETEPGLDDKEDPWLSVAEEELSSPASIASRRTDWKRKPRSVALLEPKFLLEVARIVAMHEYAFALKPDKMLEIAYMSQSLLDRASRHRAEFLQAVKLEMTLQHSQLELGKRFSLPFAYDKVTGVIWCIPLFDDFLQAIWLCVLVLCP